MRYAPTSATASRGAIVYVHPFAEELNKTRRMAALQARAMAEEGWTVLQIDLFGCGDSDGEFGQADWQQWRADVTVATTWLHDHTGFLPSLWGLRTGCLLACGAAMDMRPTPNLLLWQPVISGHQTLLQFLRLKVASQMLGDSSTDRVGTKQLLEKLRRAETVEIGGYALSPGLALGLDAEELTPPASTGHIVWLEVGPNIPAELTPASHNQIQSWQAAGHRVDARATTGSAFWQTQEIAECPELIAVTLAMIADWQT